VITSAAELATGIAELNAPSILKTAALGYDGKGQISLSPGDNSEVIWAMLGSPRAVLEQRISFDSEASVIWARSRTLSKSAGVTKFAGWPLGARPTAAPAETR
jgi:5-(carboxyamino)imidazole ribonucleotide synthase